MSVHPTSKDSEIVFMDDLPDETNVPLTVKPLEAIHRTRGRSGSFLENDNIRNPRSTSGPEFERSGSLLETDNTRNPRPTSGPEIDDLEPEGKHFNGVDNSGIDDGLLPSNGPHSPRYDPTDGVEFPRPPLLPPSLPDVNVYQHKKTLAQGMMDLALLSANANQLRYVLQTDGKHPYYYPSLTMIGTSLILQIAVGIGLIWNSRYNVKDDSQMCKADRANNWTVIGIFLVTILNVFISSFGVVDQPPTVQQ